MNTNELYAGRELDALVAEKVFGERTFWYNEDGKPAWLTTPGDPLYNYMPAIEAQHYSTELSAAWLVWETLPYPKALYEHESAPGEPPIFVVICGGGWRPEGDQYDKVWAGIPNATASGASPSEAICRAALGAFDGDRKLT